MEALACKLPSGFGVTIANLNLQLEYSMGNHGVGGCDVGGRAINTALWRWRLAGLMKFRPPQCYM